MDTIIYIIIFVFVLYINLSAKTIALLFLNVYSKKNKYTNKKYLYMKCTILVN